MPGTAERCSIALREGRIVVPSPSDLINTDPAESAHVFELVVFRDGFESGDTVGWPTTLP